MITKKEGKGSSRDMYKRPTDKDNMEGGIECGRGGVGRTGKSNGGKMRTTEPQ